MYVCLLFDEIVPGRVSSSVFKNKLVKAQEYFGVKVFLFLFFYNRITSLFLLDLSY